MPSASAARSAAALAHADPGRAAAARRARPRCRVRAADGDAAPHAGGRRFLLSIFTTAIEPDELVAVSRCRCDARARAGAFACSPARRRFRHRVGGGDTGARREYCGDRAAAPRDRRHRSGAGAGRAPGAAPDARRSHSRRAGRRGSATAVAAAVEIEDNERIPIVFRRELVEQPDARRARRRAGACAMTGTWLPHPSP